MLDVESLYSSSSVPGLGLALEALPGKAQDDALPATEDNVRAVYRRSRETVATVLHSAQGLLPPLIRIGTGIRSVDSVVGQAGAALPSWQRHLA